MTDLPHSERVFATIYNLAWRPILEITHWNLINWLCVYLVLCVTDRADYLGRTVGDSFTI